MERATQIDERGYYLTGDGIYSDWGMPEKFRGDDIDRLAAYEDTGLDPEEIVELMGRLNVIDFNWHDSPGEPGPPGIATNCD